MKLSWIFCIVSRFVLVFLITCSTWPSIRRFFRGSWTLARAGISHDSHVHMCGRLRGGAGGGRVQIEGEWNCQACGMIGCWPTKRQCFRCGTPRYVQNGGAVGGKPRGPPREQNALGRPPAFYLHR